MTPAPQTSSHRVLIVTGMSGAGKSSALRAFEDGGFETVDNLPVALLGAVVAAGTGPLAIGIDVRTRDFDAQLLLRTLEAIRQDTKLEIGLVFLDCDSETLSRRYTETRRPHPAAEDVPVAVGIETERRLLAPLREEASLLIDTSHLAPAEIKRIISGQYGGAAVRPLRIFLTSFGYRYGLPRDADLVFDVRFLQNPHYVPDLKPQSGMDAPVAAFISRDPALEPFLERLIGLLDPLLPLYEAEGKSYLTIAIGCTGGQHRSVYIVERLKAWLSRKNTAFSVRHRDVYANPT
jgi:UPF0042 nucleotide-binding protein